MSARAGVALATALAALAAPAAAQTVRGSLVNAPLPGGSLALLDSAGVTVDSTRSGTDGAFSLRATSPGTYFVYLSHPGYASVPSAPGGVSPRG